jgi:Mg2+/citrate symporter
MDEFIIWIIIFALIIIIGNQARERQARETEGMTKKQKEKYFRDIKKKQKENTKILWWVLGIIFVIILFVFFALI